MMHFVKSTFQIKKSYKKGYLFYACFIYDASHMKSDEGRRRCRNMFAKLKVVVYVLKII